MKSIPDNQDMTPDRLGFIKVGANAWTNEKYTIQLTQKEKKVCIAKKMDLEKVLLVKRCLLKGFTPTGIKKEHSISRNTVYKYKKILKDSLESTGKVHEKYTKNEGIKKSVLPLVLFFSGLGYESTLYIIFAGFGLIGAVFIAHWKQKRDSEFRLKRRADTKPLLMDFYEAMDLMYLQYAIVCYSTQEVAKYNYLLKAFKNRNRKVQLIERFTTETQQSQFLRGEKLKDQHAANYWQKIQKGRTLYHVEIDKLFNKGLLDYFYSHDEVMRAASQLFLLDLTNPLRERREIDALGEVDKMVV